VFAFVEVVVNGVTTDQDRYSGKETRLEDFPLIFPNLTYVVQLRHVHSFPNPSICVVGITGLFLLFQLNPEFSGKRQQEVHNLCITSKFDAEFLHFYVIN